MREYFVNVYRFSMDPGGPPFLGMDSGTRDGANMNATGLGNPAPADFVRCGVAYRLHVRLKPEGAPRRYASEANRRAWEMYPEECKMLVETCDLSPLLLTHSG